MFKLEITETCLRNGYNKRFDEDFESVSELEKALCAFCKQRGIDDEKIKSRYRSVKRGMAEGVKVFYNPEPGVRIYVWIKIFGELEYA